MAKSARRALAAILLLAGIPSPAGAQGHHGNPVVPSDAIRLPCCRCLDGSHQTVTIDTRAAPWRVALPGTSSFQPVAPAANAAWAPVPPADWVGPPGAPTAIGDYTYRLRFWFSPTCLIPVRIAATGRVGADNRAQVLLDGQPLASSQGTINYGFLPGNITPFAGAVAGGGLHSLTVIVHNEHNVTGMIVQGVVTLHCPTQAEDGTIVWDRRVPRPADRRR